MALLAYEILKSDTPPWGLPHTKQMNSKIGLGALLRSTRWRVSTQEFRLRLRERNPRAVPENFCAPLRGVCDLGIRRGVGDWVFRVSGELRAPKNRSFPGRKPLHPGR